MSTYCACKQPFQVNSTGPRDTAGLIVSDLYCDGCGCPLSNDDRRIPMIQRVGLEQFSKYVRTFLEWDTIDIATFGTTQLQRSLRRSTQQQARLSAYGMVISLWCIVLSLANVFDWWSPHVRAFLLGASIGALSVLLWFTVRQNREIRRI